MIVHTYQLCHHRTLVRQCAFPLLDTTVKSGYPQVAPTWDMVLQHKRGTMSDDEYRYWYRQILLFSWEEYPDFWDHLLSLPEVGLGCYCKPGKFCHRHELAQFIVNSANAVIGNELFPNKC